jgi:nucleoside transporter
MGNYLGVAGLGSEISWFYAIQGIVSIFMPTLMGIVADKWIQPQRLLGLCHLAAGAFMLVCWWMGVQAGFGQEIPDKGLFIAMYTMSVAFFMPTIALANTTAFTILKEQGMDTVKDFPPIRVLGTVGFIATMWFVNCAVWEDGSFSMTLADNAHKFQYTYMQFFVSGVLSLVLFAYCLTLPECRVEKKEGKMSLAESFGLNAFKLFKTRKMALFFIFSALLGMCLQVTNGFAGPFITSFKGDPAYAGCMFINANSSTAPGIVDADCNPILDRSEVYSGVYGRASINLYAFNSNGNKGIACGLNNLQKIRDGEPMGSRSRAEDDFATDDDEDFLS